MRWNLERSVGTLNGVKNCKDVKNMIFCKIILSLSGNTVFLLFLKQEQYGFL